jgi:Spy/CpxP family protein refolding chaperone
MKLRQITLTATCLALLATISIAGAQDPKGQEKGHDWQNHRHHKWGNSMERMTKALDLTPDQQAKIQPILDQAKPQIIAARKESMEKVKAIRDNTHAQIRPLLTPVQQQKFDALQKAREDMHKARQEMREALKDSQ